MQTAMRPATLPAQELASTSYHTATSKNHKNAAQQQPCWMGQARRLPPSKRQCVQSRAAATAERLADVRAAELQWERPLQIIQYPDPRLRAPNANVTDFDSNLERFAADLFETMYNGDDGVGLAAPQVGVNIRLMVFNETGQPGGRKEQVLINPEIVELSDDAVPFEEGCLSFPRIFADVVRPSKVVVKAVDLKGRPVTLKLDKFPARIFQHEYDHLQGVLFHDRMDAGEQKKIKPDLKALIGRFRRKHPAVAPAK